MTNRPKTLRLVESEKAEKVVPLKKAEQGAQPPQDEPDRLLPLVGAQYVCESRDEGDRAVMVVVHNVYPTEVACDINYLAFGNFPRDLFERLPDLIGGLTKTELNRVLTTRGRGIATARKLLDGLDAGQPVDWTLAFEGL